MSTFVQASVTCPVCGTTELRTVAASINVIRTPAARDQILEGTFQVFRCGACRREFLYTGEFSYLDLDRRQLFGVFPSVEETEWPTYERRTEDAYRASLGEDAPPVARPFGEGLVVRTVFGLPALREKLLLADAGIDDVLFEAAKLDLMRMTDEVPVDASHRLRLIDLDDDEVRLGLLDHRLIRVPRADLERWMATAAESRAQFDDGLADGSYVDLGRILVG